LTNTDLLLKNTNNMHNHHSYQGQNIGHLSFVSNINKHQTVHISNEISKKKIENNRPIHSKCLFDDNYV